MRGPKLELRAIGHVACEGDEATPLEAWSSMEGRIVLDPALVGGLEGLEPGEKILVIFWFDRSKGFALKQHPKGDTSRPKRGVFSLRSPRRPNPIGVSEVELLAIERNVLSVRGLDALDGTPVLDIKPIRRP